MRPKHRSIKYDHEMSMKDVRRKKYSLPTFFYFNVYQHILEHDELQSTLEFSPRFSTNGQLIYADHAALTDAFVLRRGPIAVVVTLGGLRGIPVLVPARRVETVAVVAGIAGKILDNESICNAKSSRLNFEPCVCGTHNSSRQRG